LVAIFHGPARVSQSVLSVIGRKSSCAAIDGAESLLIAVERKPFDVFAVSFESVVPVHLHLGEPSSFKAEIHWPPLERGLLIGV
jgi:hypothetical protein